MGKIRIDRFAGEFPKINPEKLEPHQAQTATNVNLFNGALRPLNAPADTGYVTTNNSAGTIHRYGSEWLEWPNQVYAVDSNDPNDPYNRVYFAGDGPPKVTFQGVATEGSGPYPTTSYRWGVPYPADAPTATVSGGTSETTTVYVGDAAYSGVSAGELVPGRYARLPATIQPDPVYVGRKFTAVIDAAPNGLPTGLDVGGSYPVEYIIAGRTITGVDAVLPEGAYNVDISADGQYIVFRTGSSPYIWAFKYQNDTWTRLNIPTPPSDVNLLYGTGAILKFHGDTLYFGARGSTYDTHLPMYTRVGDGFYPWANKYPQYRFGPGGRSASQVAGLYYLTTGVFRMFKVNNAADIRGGYSYGTVTVSGSLDTGYQYTSWGAHHTSDDGVYAAVSYAGQISATTTDPVVLKILTDDGAGNALGQEVSLVQALPYDNTAWVYPAFFGPTGEYLALRFKDSSTGGWKLRFYYRSAAAAYSLANVSDIPTDADSVDVEFSADGVYMAVAQTGLDTALPLRIFKWTFDADPTLSSYQELTRPDTPDRLGDMGVSSDLLVLTGQPASTGLFTVESSPIQVYLNTADTFDTTSMDAVYQLVFSGLDVSALPDATYADVQISLLPGADSGQAAEARSYLITYVDMFGSEGPPSAPSPQVDPRPDDTVTVTFNDTPPSSEFPLKKRYIYRANAGSSADAIWQFVAETPIADSTFVDTVPPDNLGEMLQSEEWDMPPIDMRGVVKHPAGFFVGFRDRQLLFSEPGLPTAWPVRYRLPVMARVLGIAMFGSYVAVLTDEVPYIASGVHPSAMSLSRIETLPQACASRSSVVELGYGVAYAAPDGLVLIRGVDNRVITEGIIERAQWQALNPGTIRGHLWEGIYLGIYENDDGTPGGFLINPLSPESGMVPLDAALLGNLPYGGGFRDLQADKLYLAQDTSIVEWDAGDPTSYTWESARARGPASQMNVTRVEAESYPVTITVEADGTQHSVTSVADDTPHRLPRFGRAKTYTTTVEGTAEVTAVELVSTVDELS